MKSNAPWSVKGIEKDARETAKAAAQREGMTVGEWLNQIIYQSGDPDAPATAGEIDGLMARDLASAIEHLSRRIAQNESKNSQAVEHLARSLGGAVERLQRIERNANAETADPTLAARIRVLEEKSTDRQRIEALRALERAVGQIAVQFTNAEKSTVARLDAAERQMQAIAERIDAAPQPDHAGDSVSTLAVREAIEGIAARVARAEKIAAEAAQLKDEAAEAVDADFIQKTGLRMRILGDEIKRGGDQIRTLETTIQRLTQQIDAAEKRSAEGVQKVAETIADLRERFASADAGDQAAQRAEIEAAVSEIAQRTEDRIESLQTSFDAMVRRLENAAARGGEAPRAAPLAAMARPVATAPMAQPVLEPADEEFEDAFDAVDDIALDDIAVEEIAGDAAQPAADAAADIDSELEDAFAALDLEEPAPVVVARAPHFVTPPAAAEPGDDADESDDGDEFGFDADHRPENRPEDLHDASETEDVLAEIREAFGIDAPARAAEIDDEEPATAIAGIADDDIEFAPETPPVAVAAPSREDAPAPVDPRADYLKAARQAARDAAAKAAADEAAPRRKLTPKQRAILAARIKRRKDEAELNERARALAAAPENELTATPQASPEPADEDESQTRGGAIKARLSALAAKIKRRPATKTRDDEETPHGESIVAASAFDDDDAPKPASPDILAGVRAATAKFGKIPNAGGVLGLGAGIILAALAAVFLLKDSLGKKPQRPAAARAKVETATPAPAATTDGAAIATAGEPLVRPRDLYLENIAALKNATSDAEAKSALVHIEEAATLGHPPAQLQIGELYKLGQLYDRDLGAARLWFERAANGGNVLAMHRLGVMSARGEGGPIDPAASVAWFEKAANLGLVDSQYNLGATYHPTPEGAANGVQDRGKAYFWYSIAAKNGDAQAGEMAAGLAGGLSTNERATLDAEIAAWAPKTPDPAANELAAQ